QQPAHPEEAGLAITGRVRSELPSPGSVRNLITPPSSNAGEPQPEAKHLYETFAVPAPGAPLFQAAAANLNPWSEAKVDSLNPERGPLLLISGEKDNTVPWAITNAAYKKQHRNEKSVTEIVEMPNRGHSLTIDSGWREVCDTALGFVQRFTTQDRP
ncbi:alpha/beta hydrolase family protein, partial [Nocardia puris]